MRTVMLYHPQSEFARIAEEYVHDFKKRHDIEIELISLDEPAGSDMARLYDVVRYPALLVIDNVGVLLKAWEGEIFPLMDEVVAYSR